MQKLFWEKINNKDFNYPEFGVIEQSAGTNRFIMSAGQWIKRTKAVGLIVKAGRYGGTYAHKTDTEYISKEQSESLLADAIELLKIIGSIQKTIPNS